MAKFYSLSPNTLSGFHELHTIHIPRPLRIIKWVLIIGITLLVIGLCIIPWVQTAYGTGTVIALNPDDRPQPINALISGRIKQWYVEEGSIVQAGDPLLEIVDNDANFATRLQENRDALENKVDAARIALDTERIDLDRQHDLFKQGLSSRRVYEKAKIAFNAKRVEEAKALAALNNAKVALARQDVQILKAPRDGMIMNIISGDSATTVKSGDQIATFVPTDVKLAVELYVDGVDVALIKPGRLVRLQFEGWPAIQFSGWPSTAVGTYSGVVHKVDPSVSPNGQFRILITEDSAQRQWPDQNYLRLGANVRGWVLLEEVILGYELWRNFNNFPPEFSELSAANSNVKAAEK